MPKLLQNAANAGCANRPTLSLQLRCHAPIAMMVISRSRQIVVMDFSPRKPSITATLRHECSLYGWHFADGTL
jgi:hypothetical protein